jgi:hypothetical protein
MSRLHRPRAARADGRYALRIRQRLHAIGTPVFRCLIVVALLSGCADLRSFPPETRGEELTWQALHAIDIAQTHGIAHDPDCYSKP